MKRFTLLFFVMLLFACAPDPDENIALYPITHCGVNCAPGHVKATVQIDGDYQIAGGWMRFWVSTKHMGVFCLDTIAKVPLANDIKVSVPVTGFSCGQAVRVDFDGNGWLEDGTEIFIQRTITQSN